MKHFPIDMLIVGMDAMTIELMGLGPICSRSKRYPDMPTKVYIMIYVICTLLKILSSLLFEGFFKSKTRGKTS